MWGLAGWVRELFGGRPSAVGCRDGGVQGWVRGHVGGQRGQWGANRSGVAGPARLGEWLHWQAAVSDRETVHSEQVEPAAADVVNVVEDLV
jgi:hypothetical protein